MLWILCRRRAVEAAHKVVSAVPKLAASCIAHEAAARLAETHASRRTNRRYIVLCDEVRDHTADFTGGKVGNRGRSVRKSFRLYDLEEQRVVGDQVDVSRDSDTLDTATESILLFYGLRVFDHAEDDPVQKYLGAEYVSENDGKRCVLEKLPDGGYRVVLRQRYSARSRRYEDVSPSGRLPRRVRRRW